MTLDRWVELVAGGPVRSSLTITTRRPRPGGTVRGLLAGAAEVDLTPPPGMPKAGHSKNARDGAGFRTRLKARVVHLRAGEVSVALVAADLHAGSALVHRLVADAVASDTDIPLGALMLGSTHTHAGPGQFHGCDFYNHWASNRPGLDPAYAGWLVDRLAGAVREAYATRRPARAAVGSTQVWGYTRNRSLSAHVENDTVADKRTEAQRRYAAVNPDLHLLRVDAADPSGGWAPLAALAWFSIHGTGISRHDPAYNADVWAYIAGELADGVERRTGVRPVAGAMEATHGDVTPAVRPGMLVYHEAERVGRGIGAAAAVLHESLERELSDRLALAAGYREVDLASNPSAGGVTLPSPAVGAAKLAGAVENATPLLPHLPPFRPGFPKPRFLRDRAQGEKWVFGSARLQRRVTPLDAFPRVMPVQLLRLGAAAVLALPFEVTVEAGRRLRAATAAALGGDVDVVVSSVANDYWDYLTTPEEYSLQCYEGASTLYGPGTLRFVSAVAASLAAETAPGAQSEAALAARTFTGLLRRYLPEPASAGSGPARRLAGPAHFVEATATEDAYWEQRWTAGPAGCFDWHRPLARVERLTEDGWERVADDQGWHLGVLRLGDGLYAARWYRPPLGAPASHRFVLEANRGHREVIGEGFD